MRVMPPASAPRPRITRKTSAMMRPQRRAPVVRSTVAVGTVVMAGIGSLHAGAREGRGCRGPTAGAPAVAQASTSVAYSSMSDHEAPSRVDSSCHVQRVGSVNIQSEPDDGRTVDGPFVASPPIRAAFAVALVTNTGGWRRGVTRRARLRTATRVSRSRFSSGWMKP